MKDKGRSPIWSSDYAQAFLQLSLLDYFASLSCLSLFHLYSITAINMTTTNTKAQSAQLSPLNLAIGAGVSLFEVGVFPLSFSLLVTHAFFPTSDEADLYLDTRLTVRPSVNLSKASSPFSMHRHDFSSTLTLNLILACCSIVLKTHMASNRKDNLRTAIVKTYARGGLKGFYQGLIPWVSFSLLFQRPCLIRAHSRIEVI